MAADRHSRNGALYLCMGAYFLALVCVAWVARRWKKHAVASDGHLQAHFGGSYGTAMLLLTTFSTTFSGYTVTGIPQEAYERGFVSLRWMGVSMVGVAGMLLVFPRLRRLAVERGYQSPNDFITDRYRSRRCRLLCAASGCVPMLIFLCVQMISFAAILRGLTQDAAPKWVFMLAFCGAILGLEALGGMQSVVLSDAVQSVVMIASFILVPLALGAHFGFVPTFAPADCPALSHVMPNTTGREDTPVACAMEDIGRDGCVPSGCLAAVRPEFYAFPARESACDMAFFLLNTLAFPLGPQQVQRVYIAASDRALRVVAFAMLLAPFLCQPPGIAIGLTKAALAPAWPKATVEATAVASVSDVLMQKGPLEYVLVSLLTTSTLAAIMSTADSALLGASSLVSIDVYKGFVRPRASPEEVVRAGLVSSLLSCAAAFCLGLFLEVGQMGSIVLFQLGMLMQMTPAFFLGLHVGVRERPVFYGLAAALISLPVLVLAGNPLRPFVPLVNVALVLNFVVVAALQLLAPGPQVQAVGSPGAAQHFGEQLTVAGIGAAMEGTREPRAALAAAMVFLMLCSVPFYGSPGSTEPMMVGLPRWGLMACIFFVIAVVVGACAAAQWQPPPPRPKASGDVGAGAGEAADAARPAPVAPEVPAPPAA